MLIHDASDAYSLSIDQNDSERSAGVHLSAVIKRIALRMRWLKPDDPDEERFTASGPDTLRVMAGLAWEEWLAGAHPWIDFHGGELRKDGIAMSPDGVAKRIDSDLSGGTFRLHEFKFTWKSSNRDIRDEYMYLMQIKAYCRALRTLHAALHVYYVNGNYRGSGPQYKVWLFEFTQDELEVNWRTILNEASTMPEWKNSNGK